MALQDALGNISPPRKAIDSFALPPVFIQQLSVPLKLSSGAVIHRWHSPRLHTLKPSYRSKGSPYIFLTYFKNKTKNPFSWDSLIRSPGMHTPSFARINLYRIGESASSNRIS